MNVHSRALTSTANDRLRYLERAVAKLVLRSPQSPATTTTPTWAGTFAHDAIGTFITSLAPLSAAAKLFAVAPRASFVGINTLRFPARSGPIDPAYIQWIAENAPAPVLKFSLSAGPVLGPTRKLMAFAVLTREMAESSNAADVIAVLLNENAALSLDTSLFSNAAATSARPAGILAGVTPLTAATGGGDDAMKNDLSALGAAIASVTSGLAFIAHPAQANAIKLRYGTTFPGDVPVWSTIGVAPGTVIALDPAAFVSAFGSDPEVTSAFESSLHFEDTSPQELVSSPGTVASPVKSLFQTELVATRLRLEAAWTMRLSGAVAVINSTTW